MKLSRTVSVTALLLLMAGLPSTIRAACNIDGCSSCKYTSTASVNYDSVNQSCNTCESSYTRTIYNSRLGTYYCVYKSSSISTTTVTTTSSGFKTYHIFLIIALVGYALCIAGNCWYSAVVRKENEKYVTQYCGSSAASGVNSSIPMPGDSPAPGAMYPSNPSYNQPPQMAPIPLFTQAQPYNPPAYNPQQAPSLPPGFSK